MSSSFSQRYQQGMTGKAKRPYHHGDLREQLLAAGEAALADGPVAGVTLRDIARRAGVSHAAPKHHFSSLGQLLGEIAARGFERFTQSLGEGADSIPTGTAEQRLIAMGRRYFAFAETHPAVYGLMFGKRDACEVTPHLSAAAGGAWMQLETAVAAVVGEARAKIAALLVFSAVHGYSMLKLEKRIPPAATTVANEEVFLHSLIAGLKVVS